MCPAHVSAAGAVQSCKRERKLRRESEEGILVKRTQTRCGVMSCERRLLFGAAMLVRGFMVMTFCPRFPPGFFFFFVRKRRMEKAAEQLLDDCQTSLISVGAATPTLTLSFLHAKRIGAT